MRKQKDVKEAWIILPDGTNIFDREFRAGALEFAHENGFTRIRLTNEDDMAERYLKSGFFNGGFLGVIGHIRIPALQKALAKHRVPCVLLGEESVEKWRRTMGGAVTVCSVDNEGIGQMAADYLFNLDSFASFVYADGMKAQSFDWWTNRRYDSFVRTLREHGVSAEVPRLTIEDAAPDENLARFAKAIAKLPRPVAVFAANDRIARSAVVFAQAAGLSIPEDLAVLGVDDEQTICESVTPAISSIKIEHHRLGRTALNLLVRMLAGEPTRDKVILCPPMRVIERPSTRRMLPSDTFAGKAIAFIRRANLGELDVDAVVAACGTSRSFLDRRFRHETGRTILDAIHDRVLTEVKRLLVDTDLPTSAIAQETGFKSVSGLCALFQRRYGTSMSDFRAAKRLKNS